MYINTNHSSEEINLNVSPATLEKTLLNAGFNYKITDEKAFIRAVKEEAGNRSFTVSYNVLYKALTNGKATQYVDIKEAKRKPTLKKSEVHPNDIYFYYKIMKFQEKYPNLNIQSIIPYLLHGCIYNMKDIAVSFLKNYNYHRYNEVYFLSLDVDYEALDYKFTENMIDLFTRTSFPHCKNSQDIINTTIRLREVVEPGIHKRVYEFLLSEYDGVSAELNFTITKPRNIINLNKLSPESILDYLSVFHRHTFSEDGKIFTIKKIESTIKDLNYKNLRVSLSELNFRLNDSELRYAIYRSMNSSWIHKDIVANSEQDENDVVQLDIIINNKSLNIYVDPENGSKSNS